MAYVKQVKEGDARGVLKKIYDAAIARVGSVANILKVTSLDGRSTQAGVQFYVSLMKVPNALAPARREMLAAVVSNLNDCYY